MIDVSELEAFARKCEAMQADLKPYAGKTLEEIGEEFLDIVQAQIQGAHNVDKGTLFGSFTKGGAGNIFQLDRNRCLLRKMGEQRSWTATGPVYPGHMGRFAFQVYSRCKDRNGTESISGSRLPFL